MRSTIIAAALLSVVSLSTGALAEVVGTIKTGAFVSTSDGKRIGRVYDIDKAADGSASSVAIIVDNKIIHIQASTLTASDKGLTTSLTNADIKKLR
jgi:sporulation protein YlmC with PRC-barrel domain